MSIIHLYNEQHSPELQSFLTELRPNVDKYVSARDSVQKERMIIIGKVAEYKEQFPQRSSEHRQLRQAMNSEWSADVIDNAAAAYKEYVRLKETEVEEYVALAEAANPSQLKVLGRNKDTDITYDAAKHLKQTGEVPSKNKLEQYSKNRLNSKFESRTVPGRNSDTQPSQSSSKPAQPTVKKPMTEEQRLHQAKMKRLGIDEDRLKHLESIVSLDTLPHIKDIETAQIWNGGISESIERCLDVIEQKLSLQTKPSCQIELRLREILSRHMKRIEAHSIDAVELSDNGEDLSIHYTKLSVEGRRRRAMKLNGR